jgi:hypothetical protein
MISGFFLTSAISGSSQNRNRKSLTVASLMKELEEAISLRVKLAGLDIHAVSREEIAAGH